MIFYSMGVYTQVCLVYPQCSGVPPGVPTPVWPHRPFTRWREVNTPSTRPVSLLTSRADDINAQEGFKDAPEQYFVMEHYDAVRF